MEIIEAIRQGNATAFEEAFNMFHENIFGFFMKKTNLDKELSKELTQLTFIRLWQSKHTLSESHPLSKQLFVMAKHTLIDFIRKETKLTKSKAAFYSNSFVQAAVPNTDNAIFEGNDYIMAQLKVLPPVRNKVLQMKVLYGYSNKQIAASLSISIKTVEDHITKGLSELRSHATLSMPLAVFCILGRFM